MKSNIEIEQSSPSTRISTVREGINRLNNAAKQLTAPEIRYYIQTYMPAFSARNYAGPRATSLSQDKIDLLNSFKSMEVAMILHNASEKVRSIDVTTFNVTEVLKDKGFSVDYVSRIPDAGNSKLKGNDGTLFPLENKEGYAKFSYRETTLYMPVRNHLINTNYFALAGINNTLFQQQLAELSHIMATLYYMSNGVVKTVLAPEAGMNLLNFAYYLDKAFETTDGSVTGYIKEWIYALPAISSAGWTTTTLHGQAFAHVFYSALTKALTVEDYFLVVQQITQCIFGEVINDQGERQNILDIADDGALVINRRPLALPTILANQSMKLAEKEATLHQADRKSVV